MPDGVTRHQPLCSCLLLLLLLLLLFAIMCTDGA
jgi:hypothetical protein